MPKIPFVYFLLVVGLGFPAMVQAQECNLRELAETVRRKDPFSKEKTIHVRGPADRVFFSDTFAALLKSARTNKVTVLMKLISKQDFPGVSEQDRRMIGYWPLDVGLKIIHPDHVADVWPKTNAKLKDQGFGHYRKKWVYLMRDGFLGNYIIVEGSPDELLKVAKAGFVNLVMTVEEVQEYEEYQKLKKELIERQFRSRKLTQEQREEERLADKMEESYSSGRD